MGIYREYLKVIIHQLGMAMKLNPCQIVTTYKDKKLIKVTCTCLT